MADRQRADGMDISAFAGVLRRRGLIIGAAILAAAGAAYFVSKGQDEKYTGTAKLLLKGAPRHVHMVNKYQFNLCAFVVVHARTFCAFGPSCLG